MTISDGGAGFPAGLYVTTGPLTGSEELPPGSGTVVPASDRLIHVPSAGAAVVFADGFNSNETAVFAPPGYGGGLLVSEPRENRIVRLMPDGTHSVFATGVGTTPFGPAALAIGADGKLYATDFTGRAIVRVEPDGTVAPFATIPAISGGGKALAALSGGGFVAGTFTPGVGNTDALFQFPDVGSLVSTLVSGLSGAELVTPGPGGAYGSDLFVATLRGVGPVAMGDGGIFTLSASGVLTPFLTGLDPTHVVFDVVGVLGGGMFVTDFNQTLTGFADGPGRIWRVTAVPLPATLPALVGAFLALFMLLVRRHPV